MCRSIAEQFVAFDRLQAHVAALREANERLREEINAYQAVTQARPATDVALPPQNCPLTQVR